VSEDTQLAREAAAGAQEAASHARSARERLRWSTAPGDPDREAEIASLLDQIDRYMRPVRAARGRAVWEELPNGVFSHLVAASNALQYERKQLKKMRRR
jgi:hypothetical protein